jgi:hypothetical protein
LGFGTHFGLADAGTGGSFVLGLEAEHAWGFFAAGAEWDYLGVINKEYSYGHLNHATTGIAFAELRSPTPRYVAPFVRLGLGIAQSSVEAGPQDHTGASGRMEIGLRVRLVPVFMRLYFSETAVPGGSFGAWSFALGLAEDASPPPPEPPHKESPEPW